MMKIIKKFHLLTVFSLFLSPTVAQNPSIATATQVQADKKVKYQFPSEFKQAVAYYIKRTDNFHPTTRDIDENSAYKKELRYLLKNYGKFSVITLLSRVRSAHQTMVTQETNSESDVYQQYEKICSALLLVCAQVFFNETRSHLLEALHEIDNLLVYWRYQRNHQIHYFFSKSPLKWVMGKEQAKEISYNIVRLERKQKELYTLLGSLIGHAHAFTTLDGTHQACYAWIEQLLEKVTFSQDISYGATDGSSFDEHASQLENKLKRIKNFKSECLSSLVGARKPNHFVRNWVQYATLCAATAYLIHYGSKNPEVMNSAFNAVQDEVSKFLILLLHPLQKVYERGKLIFAEDKKEDKSKEQTEKEKVEEPKKQDEKPIDREAELMKLVEQIKKVGAETDAAIAAELAKSNKTVRETGLQAIRETLNKVDSQTKENIEQALKKIENIIEPIKIGEDILNEKEVNEYKNALYEVLQYVDRFSKGSWCLTADSRSSWWDINMGAYLILADDGYLNPLQKYTEIIDNKILRIFQLASEIIDNLVFQTDDLIKKANVLEAEATQQLKEAKQQLKDHELTLMFTSLIPLGIITFGTSKLYQWSISRDYSPIRIALSEVNSLLIEADNYVDDHYYGKLIYLLCKLRHKSDTLKDPMANDFLDDVAKLESKQYSTQTKRAMVENMFNKYAFLGKVAA